MEVTYSKVKQQEPSATQFYSVHVSEGWRTWILGTDMHERVANQLIAHLEKHPIKWNY